MLESINPLAELLRRDRRYRADAYFFVFDALRFAQEHLGMGQEAPSLPLPPGLEEEDEFEDDELDDEELDDELDDDFDDDFDSDEADESLDAVDPEHVALPAADGGKHVSGQQLCEAIRRYALDQYGLLAKHVLSQWGVTKTDDFGEIVFNLIDIGKMRRTQEDSREDFVNVFDFEEGLVNQFRFRAPEVSVSKDK